MAKFIKEEEKPLTKKELLKQKEILEEKIKKIEDKESIEYISLKKKLDKIESELMKYLF
jgi:chaperonin cofactor prefoldin